MDELVSVKKRTGSVGLAPPLMLKKGSTRGRSAQHFIHTNVSDQYPNESETARRKQISDHTTGK